MFRVGALWVVYRDIGRYREKKELVFMVYRELVFMFEANPKEKIQVRPKLGFQKGL